jgi:hypothetical protein
MPLPHFVLEDRAWWTATARLPSWAGFQARAGAYGAKSSKHPSDGTVRVCFAPEGRGAEPLDPSELSLVGWFFEHEAGVSQAVQKALLAAYPGFKDQYEVDVDGNDLPDALAVGDLMGLVGLHTVNIHQVSRDGVPYIGFEFGCNWDDEHGLGVLMHGTQLVEVGGADTAILLWLARRHAEGEGYDEA